MPENEMPTEQTQSEPVAAPAGETKTQKLEREQLSRRAALRKLGYTSVLSVFALFSVDDLARMVGRAMEQKARDNEVAEVVARELRDAGLAMAQPTGPYASCAGAENLTNCLACNQARSNGCQANAKTPAQKTACTNCSNTGKSDCNANPTDWSKFNRDWSYCTTIMS